LKSPPRANRSANGKKINLLCVKKKILTIAHGVEAPLFARYNDVGHGFGFLPALGSKFQMAITVNHGQHAVGSISETKLR
jgi:hypothetical protein